MDVGGALGTSWAFTTPVPFSSVVTTVEGGSSTPDNVSAMDAELLANITQTYGVGVAEGLYLDRRNRMLVLRDEAAVADENNTSITLEHVPNGINLFTLLNLPVPGNITSLYDWKVVFSNDSFSYGNLSIILQVSFGCLVIFDI